MVTLDRTLANRIFSKNLISERRMSLLHLGATIPYFGGFVNRQFRRLRENRAKTLTFRQDFRLSFTLPLRKRQISHVFETSKLILHRCCIACEFDVTVSSDRLTSTLADNSHRAFPIGEGQVQLLVGQMRSDLQTQLL